MARTLRVCSASGAATALAIAACGTTKPADPPAPPTPLKVQGVSSVQWLAVGRAQVVAYGQVLINLPKGAPITLEHLRWRTSPAGPSTIGAVVIGPGRSRTQASGTSFPITGAGAGARALSGYTIESDPSGTAVYQLEIGMKLPARRGTFGFRGLILTYSQAGRVFMRRISGAILYCEHYAVNCPVAETARFTGLSPSLIRASNKDASALSNRDSHR